MYLKCADKKWFAFVTVDCFISRHVLFAPSMLDSYTGASFPSLTDSLFQIEKVSGNEKFERWEAVKQQLSIVTFLIEAASASLAKPTEF